MPRDGVDDGFDRRPQKGGNRQGGVVAVREGGVLAFSVARIELCLEGDPVAEVKVEFAADAVPLGPVVPQGSVPLVPIGGKVVPHAVASSGDGDFVVL